MNMFDIVIASATLASAIVLSIYAVKTYARELPEAEILPWDVFY